MLRNNDSSTLYSSSVHDRQLSELVTHACDRIRDELARRAPSLGEKVCGWMAHLSPTGKAPDYFLQPRIFPLLRLPLWAARTFAAEPDYDFLADVVYSSVNGYYYIRLLDNLMDGHGTIELKILPAAAFFHSEFQATYHKYFDTAHPFWEVFRSAWFSASNAVAREVDLDTIDQEDFEKVTVVKLAGARIPLAAVGFRHNAGDRLRSWEEFTLALARWSQIEDDLFDWHHDLLHGKTSFFLTEARKHNSFDSVEAWMIRAGFQQGMEILQRELSSLRLLVDGLNSPDVVRYLDLRETTLESQKIRIFEAFQVLQDVAAITEAPAAQTVD
jgi:hypothetical protein